MRLSHGSQIDQSTTSVEYSVDIRIFHSLTCWIKAVSARLLKCAALLSGHLNISFNIQPTRTSAFASCI